MVYTHHPLRFRRGWAIPPIKLRDEYDARIVAKAFDVQSGAS